MEAGDVLRRVRLAGDLTQIPSEEFRKCIRVFLCAEPRDSESERRVLRERVYPKLREYCRQTHGVEFQVFDGYYGVDTEDMYSPYIRQCRMKVLQECLRSSAGPCFVALIGEQYGNSCLPTQIDAVEFEKITETAAKIRVCTKTLEAWYCRDENAVPPVYNMLEKKEETNAFTWKEAVTDLQELFDVIVPVCVKEGTLKADQAKKYSISALEEELLLALSDQPPALLERCICYVHKIPYVSLKKKGQVTFKTKSTTNHATHVSLETSDHKKLCQLRNVTLPALALQEGLQVFSSTTTCDMKVGYTEERKQAYLEGLCRQFYTDMLRLIEATVPRKTAHLDWVSEEAMQHISLCNMYADLYTYECKEMVTIMEYIQQNEAHRTPLVVAGEPCSGKTVLLAACVTKMQTCLKCACPKLIVRFSCACGNSINLHNLLAGLCQQIAEIYQLPMQKHQKDVKELGRCFIDFLNASFQQNPLVLILDVLDHIAEDDNARSLWWLPESFPPYVKIIISATLGTSEIFGNLKNLYKDQTLFLHLKPERKVCNEYLKQSLLENQRKVTSGQQMYVNRCLGKNTSPLMVNLLFKELMQWRSHEDVSDQTLGDSVHESIERLFLRLEEKYGRKFVSRALGYITLSRSGIGETELVDILSTDDTVAADFVSSNQATDIWRVPESLVACLVLALRGCLSQRLFMGSMVLCWTHFCYQLVVFKQYLSDATVVHDLHTTMGHYFSGRWACGRPKPYLKCDHLSDSKRFSKMFIDRQQPSQPWLYGSQSSDQRSTIANLRKVHELPFHLKNCGRQEEHSTNMLTIYPVYQAMIKAQQLHLLLSEVEDTAQLSRRTELKVIGDILRESSCLLSQNPGALGMVFQAAILPLTTEYPSLLKLLKQAYHESLKSSVIVAMHSSLVTVATKCVTSIGPSGIISILEMQAGSLIIVVFVNGALYTWNEIQPLTLVYRPSQDIEARDVELSHDGRHLVVLTGSNSLMILDCATWGIMSEINGSRLPATPSHNSLDLKGLKVFGSNVYVWFKNASLVRVFHNMSGSSLSELHCPQYVTCLSSTKHGKYVLVGQQSIVSIFDNSTFSHQSAISCTFEGHCIKVVYVSESDTEVYIVDTIGNISAWDILDPCQPQYLDEIHNSEESSEVISVEHSSDFKLLLLCKQNHVQVWNTDGWSMDEFTAPKNNSFSCALFLEDCKHIIAAMKTGTSLLVWRRDCGQCVLQLRNAYGEAAKLTKCLQQRCLVAVTKGGYITTWNMDLVQHAASMFKAKQPIRSILLCPSGEHLYASDGSEMVYKWRSSSFVVKAVLKHDHPIASTQLTVTGEFLVTLETFGDLYIWSTNTGENLFRIRGSQASQVLLTPNGHFGVTLCKNSVSRVWKLTTGHVVCTFHTHLQPAYISPESTFIMGINRGDLTAFSLWSGCVSKTFQCNEQSNVLAFQTLLNHPDITVVITTRRNIYTWNMAEETICYQMELPSHFPSEVSDCQMSSDGSIIMSMAEQSIHVLNTHSGKLGRLCTDGKVLYQHLSKDGRKVFFVSFINENQWDCDFHANPVLQVVQVSNGETIGQYFLGKMPSCFTVSEDDVTICIGYDDGTIGVYTVIESDEDREQLENSISFKSKYAQGTTAIKTFLSKEIPDIMWMDSHDVFPEE